MITFFGGRFQLGYLKRLVTIYVLTICRYFNKYWPKGCSLLDLTRIKIHVNGYTNRDWGADLPVAFSIPIDLNNYPQHVTTLQEHINKNLNDRSRLIFRIDKAAGILTCSANALNNRLRLLKLTQYDGMASASETISAILASKPNATLSYHFRDIIELCYLQDNLGLFVKLVNGNKNTLPSSVQGYITDMDPTHAYIDPIEPGIMTRTIIKVNDPWLIEELRFDLSYNDIILDRRELAAKANSTKKIQVKFNRQNAQKLIHFPDIGEDYYESPDSDIPH